MIWYGNQRKIQDFLKAMDGQELEGESIFFCKTFGDFERRFVTFFGNVWEDLAVIAAEYSIGRGSKGVAV
jgi:hypothetical protein